ncbi:Cupredoxin [Stipitochalara longipes BDJ]|nr:Cupredoxin [Stipitochalara longipes BDJ]
MQLILAVLLSALPLTLAQYGNPNPTTTKASNPATSSTSAANPGVHTVAVGNGALAYSPDTITAAVGDTIEFHFYAPLHSVAQSNFSAPCAPSANGFFSGDISTSSGQNVDVFTVTVNDTNPIWFYCVIPTHCQLGMAGVINPPADNSNTLAQYQAAAKSVANSVTPANVQGGVIGPLKSATTSSATPSPSSKNAGSRTGGDVQWVMLAVTGAVAMVVGALII